MCVNLTLLIFRLKNSMQNILKNLGFLSSHQFVKVAFFTILFVLSMSSFASARVLTRYEVANFMLNAYAQYSGQVTETIKNNVYGQMGHWQTIADKTSQYENYWTIGYSAWQKQFFFVYYTGSQQNLGVARLYSFYV